LPGASGLPPATFAFRVLGPDGLPILDLKPEEVSLKVNNRVREIRSLELRRSDPTKSRTASPATVMAPAPKAAPPFATNYASGPGREILILVDDESFDTGRERYLKPAVGNLLASINDNDRVGLLTIPRGGVSLDPTDRHDRIETVLADMLGRQARVDTVSDAVCRALMTLGALRSFFEGFSGSSYTTVVFFSGGLAAANTEMVLRLGQPAETCELRTDHFRETGLAAQKLPIDFHVAFIPEEVAGGTAKSQNQQAGLENLAGITGNALMRLTGESDRMMAELAMATSAHYVATFEPDPAERTGAAYRVEMKVAREGAKLAARQSIVIAKAAGASKADKGPTVKDMIRVAAPARDLPIRATSFAARESGNDKLKLVALFEPGEPSVTLTAASVALFDSKGKLAAEWTAQPGDLRRSPVVGALLVKPGIYRMRVAAIDAAGRRGTVDQEATVELAASGTSPVSALVLGARTGNGFAPKMLFGSADPSLFGYVEVYNVGKDAALGASFELANSLDGPAQVTVPAGLSPASQGDTRVLMGAIPLSAVPPGDYVIRANVSVDGQPAARVVRTLRKTGQ